MAIPSLTDLNNFKVNRAGIEGIRQSLFDFLLYPTAGQAAFNFFATPQGQGLTSAVGGVAGTPKTIQDTNMTMAGTLPAGQSFLVTSIEVPFFAGSVNTANTYTLASPVVFAAVAAAALEAQLADINSFYQSGSLKLFIGSKTYLEEAPLLRFPPKTQLTFDGSMANNSATTSALGFVSGKVSGRPYMVEPQILLENNQNFSVSLNFPAAVATPSGFNARVGVILDGYMYRNSQ